MKITSSALSVLLIALSAAGSVNSQIMHNPCNDKRDEGKMAANLGASILTMKLVSNLDEDSVSARPRPCTIFSAIPSFLLAINLR